MDINNFFNSLLWWEYYNLMHKTQKIEESINKEFSGYWVKIPKIVLTKKQITQGRNIERRKKDVSESNFVR